ncbi:uncharacterized protein LOC133202194 [Saccostrea echinata]|uniref:uncharacterized protein LOC133202194 n=1 Tax=Saccostrea echinata TaxID=191078 RepID=UPI002A820D29|nr:uncharacterized protein LOC133202194 [Saccostrea echinata]
MVKIFATGLIFSVAFGCSWIPKVDQEDFCFAKYAFKASVKSVEQVDKYADYTYTIDIEEDYKNANKAKGNFDTITGDGPMMSCGPQKLKIGKSYLIYAGVRDNEGLYIVEYKGMDSVKASDIERMKTKYDCDCKIKFDYDKFMSRTSAGLPPPTKDECNVTENYCQRSAYCQRNQAGVCTWGNLGDCY